MNYKDYLQDPKKDPLLLGGLLLLYSINTHLFRITRIEDKLWNLLRLELYYLGGACQHSGQCCRHLMLYKQEKAVKKTEDFNDLCSENPDFKRFTPQLRGTNIHHYTCTCLTENNLCNDYKNRPTLCRNYPISNFLKGDTLYEGCGYKLLKSQHPFPIKNKTLKARMATYELKVMNDSRK